MDSRLNMFKEAFQDEAVDKAENGGKPLKKKTGPQKNARNELSADRISC